MATLMSDKRFGSGISFLFSKLPHSEAILHAFVMTTVLLQLLSSFFMHVHATTPLATLSAIDWYHVYAGLGLLLLTPVFMALMLKRRHWRDLYPWLGGNLSQIKADICSLLDRQLPEAKPAGLAATVEGLGLLALFLALISGTVWLLAMLQGWSDAPDLLKLHKALVGLIEAYVYGHGGFALLHLIVWWRRD